MRISVVVSLCLVVIGGLAGGAPAQDVVKVGHLGITRHLWRCNCLLGVATVATFVG